PGVTDDGGAVVQRRVGEEQGDQDLGGHLAVDAHTGDGDVLQSGLALEDDERPGAPFLEAAGGADHLVDDARDLDAAVVADQRAHPAQAPHLVEGAAQLRLEEDDQRQQDRLRAVGEEPVEHAQVELRGDEAEEEEHADAEQQLHRLRPADQLEQLVEQEGHHQHVHGVAPADLAEEDLRVVEEGAHGARLPSCPKTSASSACCTHMRFSAWSKTTDWGPSMTASVISSPRCAGRQCMTRASAGAIASSDSFTCRWAKSSRRRCCSASWPIDAQTSV